MNNQILAPIAKKNKILLENFKDERVDFYDWLRDKDYPNVNNKDIHEWDKKYKDYKNIKYPEPIVDHKKERLNTLKVYKKYIN